MKKGTLDIHYVCELICDSLTDLFAWQAEDPDSPEFGGFISQEHGLDEPGSAVMLVSVGMVGYWAAVEKQIGGSLSPASLLKRTNWAIDYLLRTQHESGLIDLRSCNYDSSPDAAFAVQRLASVLELTLPLAEKDGEFAHLIEKVKTFTRRAAEGILIGGFHTPNHRWVIVSALAQAAALFPDLPVHPVIQQYLDEGIDVDADGAYTEHSVGVYDAVCNRSLLLYAHHRGDRNILPFVHRNLTFDMHLVHADSTAETGLSRRHDYGTRKVPFSLITGYLLYQLFEPQPQFIGMINFLWEKCPQPGLDDLIWLVYGLDLLEKRKGPRLDVRLRPNEDYAVLFPKNGIWRLRRGDLSATLFRGQTRLLALCSGKAELASLKISQSYFGVGSFIGETIEPTVNGARLISSGAQAPNRPGYDYPIGSPVSTDNFYEVRATRPYRKLPPARSSLEVSEIDGGIRLHYRTHENYPGVTAQIALDFAPGGIWECGDCAIKPAAGQVIFLKSGYGVMRYGRDALRIGPGANCHRTWEMRDAETAPGWVRVIIPLKTPIDYTFSITVEKPLLGNLLFPN